MDPNHTTSTLLAQAGGLMALSGLLMALCASVAYGGILWAAAACMFFAARQFRQMENKKQDEEEPNHQHTTL